jgi:mevalonate kinase
VERATGKAGGKAILAGEHFVVHGAPAIAVPLPGVGLEAELGLPSPGSPPSGHVAACLRVVAERWGGLDAASVSVVIRSDIPIGAGLGSSAALSVALARAAARWLGRAADATELREVSLACERIAHGNPSGIDTEVAVTGRAVRFVRGEPPRTLAVAGNLGLVVCDTEAPASTREMVAAVARLRAADPAGFERRLRRAAELVDDVERALAAGDPVSLGRALDENQELLAAIGVSTPGIERLVAAARSAGAAGAKLTGKGGGGTVIAVCGATATAAVTDTLRQGGWKVVAAGTLGGGG